MRGTVVIMRGLPGSGKSSWLRDNRWWGGCSGLPRICSADLFRMVNGVYVFDKRNDARNHDLCLRLFTDLLTHTPDPIAVDNTNIRAWELAPYYRLAEAFSSEVKVVQMLADPELCKLRNVHGVPPEVIDGMAREIEALPSWWKVEYVSAREQLCERPSARNTESSPTTA